jgi:hypothetical protein
MPGKSAAPQQSAAPMGNMRPMSQAPMSMPRMPRVPRDDFVSYFKFVLRFCGANEFLLVLFF